MSAGANLTQWFAWVLMILTGAMNRRGGAWFHPGFMTPFDAAPELPITDPWTPGPKTRPDVLGVIGDSPCAALPDEIEAGNIRALMNFGGRLLRTWPDTNALRTALDKLDLHVMVEIHRNETSDTATHVLPTKDSIERPELTRWDMLGWNLSVQYSEPLVPPMGERRSAWWVIAEIMRRADLPVPDHVPADDREPDADETMLKALMAHARCSFEELRERKFVQHSFDVPGEWVDRHIERIGGWRLAPERLVEQWNEMRAADEAAMGKPKPLCFSPRRQRRKFNAQMDFLGAEATMLVHPSDAAAHGIADGGRVRVSNESGAIELVARVDAGMRRGVVSIPHGHLHANVNNLTSKAVIDRLSGMALYSGVPVTMEAAG